MCISHDQESLVWEIHFLFWKVTGKNEFQLSKFSREENENKEKQKFHLMARISFLQKKKEKNIKQERKERKK